MLKKYGLFLLVTLIMISLYLENSPTAKRVVEAVERKLPSLQNNQTITSRLGESEKETIYFLGKPALVDKNGEILLNHRAIETISTRILKQLGTDHGFWIYGSSHDKDKYLIVYDVTESLPATVNRYLGNHVVNGRVGPESDNIDIDLRGYSIFLFYYKNADGSYQEITSARWIPTELRGTELQYERYMEQLDLEISPTSSVNNEYLDGVERSDMEQQSRERRRERIYKMRERYMGRDSSGVFTVIPLKRNNIVLPLF